MRIISYYFQNYFLILHWNYEDSQKIVGNSDAYRGNSPKVSHYSQ